MWLLEQQNFSYFLHFFVIAYCLVKFCPNLNESEEETMVLSYQRIGQRIHVIRKARKLTQAELAERANLSVPYISHIENGIKQASLQAVVNIAEALGCTVDKSLFNISTCMDWRVDFLPCKAKIRRHPDGWQGFLTQSGRKIRRQDMRGGDFKQALSCSMKII